MSKLKIVNLFLLITLVLGLSACQNQAKDTMAASSQEPELQTLFQNKKYHVSIPAQKGWAVEKVIADEELNVVFRHRYSTAILTSLATDKSMEDIKNELLIGSGAVEVSENEENHLAYLTGTKEKIYTDIYIQTYQGSTYITTFMSTEKHHDKAKIVNQEFLNAMIIDQGVFER